MLPRAVVSYSLHTGSGLLYRGSRAYASRVLAVAAPVEQAPKQYTPPQEAHGFELERHQFVQEYDSLVALYRHKKTGELLLS